MLSGPSVFIGYSFLFSGIFNLTMQQWVGGIIISIIGSFLLFTYSGVEIDTEKKKIKQYYKLFGFIKTGKWKPVGKKYIGVTLVRLKEVQNVFSRSNKWGSTHKIVYKIYLVNQLKKPELAIKKCSNRDSAQDSLDEFAIWLKLPVYSIKR